MNLKRNGRQIAVAILGFVFAAAASADWQISSTNQRLLQLDDDGPVPARLQREGIEAGATVDMGGRCTVVFDAGHTMFVGNPSTLQLPRGTLEMFIDNDTALYRTEHPESIVKEANAPVIQFHRLLPRGLDETVTNPPIPGPIEELPIGWSPGSIYDDNQERGDDIPGPPVSEFTPHSRVGYSVDSASSGMLTGETELVLPPENPAGFEITSVDPYHTQLDEADLESSYWLNYDMEVWNTLRTSEGKVTLRIYFPGHATNGRTPANPEQPHYASWTIDMGMMERGTNEVFAKLEACAGPKESGGLNIDGKHTPKAIN
ncbi:MAG: hypothetical protein OXC69_00605 [Candidatus Tectomicrobia bacterium]|nr:hypothetical protein [Candidatus Tectomicrobia bacterium]